MAGKKGMTHFGETIIKEVNEMVLEGRSKREIAEHFGFKDKYVIKNLLNRKRRKGLLLAAGILPRRKGRPPKGYSPSNDEKDNEIRRLKMENELLRSFLQAAGRKCVQM